MIKEVRLSSVRSHEFSRTEFSPETTLILGRNGAGKTTILEATYYLLAGTSFRGRDRDMIAHASTRADLLLIDDNENERRASLQLTSDDSVKKTFLYEGKTSARLPAKARLPVVMFEPDELRRLSSSPERRRQFFDALLARLYPQYHAVLNRYGRILLQRNSLLKRREELSEKSFEEQMFTWDIKFSESAEQIANLRRDFIVTANQRLSQLYSEIAGSPHSVTLSYLSVLSSDNYRQKLLNKLTTSHLADSYRGYTSVGPHRDDFGVYLDSHLSNEAASRGEMRSIMLAVKLLEVDLQKELTTIPPLILLDDVLSELDAIREQRLIAALNNYQTVITATDVRDSLQLRAKIIQL